jgi:anti-anti-sigma factor
MSEARFSVTCEEVGSDTLVYRLKGKLHGYPECFQFQEVVRRDVAGGGKRVALVLRELSHIDSAGVGILASVYTSLQNANGTLVLAELSPAARRVLEIAWFLKLMDHTDTLEEALAKLGSSGS